MFFFWSVPSEWNKLDISLRESGHIKIFKSKLRRQLNSPSMLVPIYNKTTGEWSIHHARMRLGLNLLEGYSFKYNFISNSRCLLCQHRSEGATHFLLHYPALASPRATLLAKVREALAPVLYKTILHLEQFISIHMNFTICYFLVQSIWISVLMNVSFKLFKPL